MERDEEEIQKGASPCGTHPAVPHHCQDHQHPPDSDTYQHGKQEQSSSSQCGRRALTRLKSAASGCDMVDTRMPWRKVTDHTRADSCDGIGGAHTLQRVIVVALVSRLVVFGLMVGSEMLVTEDLSMSSHLQGGMPCDADVMVRGVHYYTHGDQLHHLTHTDRLHHLTHTDRLHHLTHGDQLGGMPSLLVNMSTWDSVYFLRIATCGYENEQMYAFFPLLPLFVRYIGRLLMLACDGMGYILGYRTCRLDVQDVYAGVGFLINAVAFCVAACMLYLLGMKTVKRVGVVSLAVILFCWNPASVFYSAIYTESLFACFTWMGLYLLSCEGRYWSAVMAFLGASAARSNGTLNVWFLIYRCLYTCTRPFWTFENVAQKDVKKEVQQHVKNFGKRNMSTAFTGHGHGTRDTLTTASARDTKAAAPATTVRAVTTAQRSRTYQWYRLVLETGVGCVCICAPYALMQIHGWRAFCLNKAADSRPVWCDTQLPSIYGFVQAEYWNVGFLNFYQKLNRLPLVIQSFPVVSLAFLACWTWASFDWKRAFTFGFLPDDDLIIKKKKRIQHLLVESSCIVEPEIAPYIYHLALMTAVSVLVMHVHVATRFLSSSPLLYWYMAQCMYNGGPWRERCIWIWCLLFIALGVIMYPNFYPWT